MEVNVRLGGPGPSIEIQSFIQWAFPLAIFLKYLVRKNWKGGGVSLLKNGTIDGYAC